MPDGKKKKKVSEMTPEERKKDAQSRYASAVDKGMKSGQRRKPTKDKTKMGAYKMVSKKEIQRKNSKKSITDPRMQERLDKDVKAAGGPDAYRKKASQAQQERSKNMVKVDNKYYDKRIPRHKAIIEAYQKRKKK